MENRTSKDGFDRIIPLCLTSARAQKNNILYLENHALLLMNVAAFTLFFSSELLYYR